MTSSDHLARGIRRIRLEFGMSMHEVGVLLGVHVSTVSRFESGERRIRIDRREIAERLGVRVADLISECPRCAYSPPPGFQCLRCGTVNEGNTERD
jgi:transcriptional regulator with XRE-family HTH domain